jgi:hypothetical protein
MSLTPAAMAAACVACSRWQRRTGTGKPHAPTSLRAPLVRHAPRTPLRCRRRPRPWPAFAPPPPVGGSYCVACPGRLDAAVAPPSFLLWKKSSSCSHPTVAPPAVPTPVRIRRRRRCHNATPRGMSTHLHPHHSSPDPPHPASIYYAFPPIPIKPASEPAPKSPFHPAPLAGLLATAVQGPL